METTKNFGLPQYQGNDLTDWYQLNAPFETIDTQMQANKDAAETAQQTADSNTNSIANLTESLNRTIQRVTTSEGDITDLEQRVTLNTTHNNEQDTQLQSQQAQITALQQEIGDSSAGEGTISGNVAQLQEDVETLQGQMTTAQGNIATNTDHIGNLSGLQTTAKGNLVAAINEVQNAQDGGLADDVLSYLNNTSAVRYITRNNGNTIIVPEANTVSNISQYMPMYADSCLLAIPIRMNMSFDGAVLSSSRNVPFHLTFTISKGITTNKIYYGEKLTGNETVYPFYTGVSLTLNSNHNLGTSSSPIYISSMVVDSATCNALTGIVEVYGMFYCTGTGALTAKNVDIDFLCIISITCGQRLNESYDGIVTASTDFNSTTINSTIARGYNYVPVIKALS